jgi:hypothetical protein
MPRASENYIYHIDISLREAIRMNPFSYLFAYLKDVKNLATHFLVGVIMLALLLFVPVDIHIRLAVLAGVVCLNIARMRLEGRNRSPGH